MNKNYNYFYSKLLNQKYAVNKKTKDVTFQDGVKYNQDEIEILKNKTDSEKKNCTLLKRFSQVRLRVD